MAELRATALAALALAASCGAPRHALLAAETAVRVPQEVADSVGFDASAAATEEVAWRVGDRALYEITYNEPDGRRVWFVEARYVDPAPADPDEASFTFSWTNGGETTGELFALSTVELSVLEVGGDEVHTVREGAPLRLFQRGLYDSCQRFADLAAEYRARGEEDALAEADVSAEDQRAFADGLSSLFALLRIVQEVDELKDVLYAIVDRPSLLSLALNMGVDLLISAKLDVSERVAAALPPPLAGVQAYEFPAELSLNGKRALEVVIRACPPRPPLHAFAGIVSVRCTHPKEAERWMEIRQVGARRGTAARP